MRKLLVALIVLCVVLFVGDRIAVRVASANLRDAAQQRIQGEGAVHAQIASFPFIGLILVRGDIQDVHVRVDRLTAGGLTFVALRADLHGVKIDRHVLLHQRRVRLVGLQRGTLSAELTQEEVSRAVGASVKFLSGGRATVTVGGISATATVRVSHSTLTLRAGRLPAVSFRIPRAPLLPCATQDVQVMEGRIRASCMVDHLPEELARLDVLHAV